MKDQTKSNWPNRMVFAAITSIVFIFVASSPLSAQETRTIKQFAQLQVGEYRVASEVEGSPEKDGFPLAVETRQYKYNAGDTLAIHYTVARYSSAAEAQNMLRTILDRYRQMKLNITPVAILRDKDRKITGISADMSGKMFVRFWTKDEFVIRAMGVKEDVEAFFTVH